MTVFTPAQRAALETWYPYHMRTVRMGIEKQALHHAYCLMGDHQETGQESLMQLWAEQLLCQSTVGSLPCDICPSCQAMKRGNHEDVLQVTPAEGKRVIDIDAAHSVRQHLSKKPLFARYRVVLIPAMERMTPSCANALLKTLEEPPQHAILLMTASKKERILPTLLSRLYTLYVPPLAKESIHTVVSATETAAESEQSTLVQWINGSADRALHVIEQQQTDAYTQWKEERAVWETFLQADIGYRDQFIQQTEYKTEAAIPLLQSILYDTFQQFIQQSQIDHAQETARKLDILAKAEVMSSQHVNEKMIYDYLITAL
jgi:DNA polymerase III delta prime subunit